MKLQGKHAVVTGGGRGIGAAVAQVLAAEGARLTLMGRNLEPLEATCAKLGTAQPVQADVGKAEEVELAFQKATKAFGAIDILVNNAGVAESAPFERTSLEHLQTMLNVNVTGTFLCTQAALKTMKKGDWGRVVNVASTAGLKGYAYVSAYCAAKHAVVGLTRALALELARTGITVNAVCPGYTETEMVERSLSTIQEKTGKSREEAVQALEKANPQGRLVKPEEVAATVRWLCEAASGAITGQSIVVAGGEVM